MSEDELEAAQRIVTDFDIKLPRALDALIVARALLSRRPQPERDAVLEEASTVVDREYRRAVGSREAKALLDAMRAIRALKENT